MTRKAVIQELQTFDTTFTDNYWDDYQSTAHNLFNFFGVVVISNGLVYKENILERDRKLDTLSAQLDRIPQAVPQRMQTNMTTIAKTRKHFPETWLWTSMQTGSNGCAVIKSTIPDTITSWFISAFAMHMETGLGIATTPTKVTVFRPFFIKLSLPYSIIRGETVAIEVIVFNYTTKPIESEVVFDNKKQEFEFSDQLDTKGIAVPGSQKVWVTAIGDIGCGEQNMINFVPNIVVLNYLKQTNRLTQQIKSKAISNIEIGYQRELTYKRRDGSFSAFGDGDSSGSTWLTAFVVKAFIQAKGLAVISTSCERGYQKWAECLSFLSSLSASLSDSHHIYYGLCFGTVILKYSNENICRQNCLSFRPPSLDSFIPHNARLVKTTGAILFSIDNIVVDIYLPFGLNESLDHKGRQPRAATTVPIAERTERPVPSLISQFPLISDLYIRNGFRFDLLSQSIRLFQ
ncbi:unnamed protein product, partial [Oppiella nova]